jgi:thimet oligopeptidase
LKRVAAIAWPIVGTFVLALEAAIRAALGEPMQPQVVLWGWIGWLEWTLLAPLVVLLAERFPYAERRRAFLFVHAVAPFAISILHSGMYFGLRTLFLGAPGPPGVSLRSVWIARWPGHLTLDVLVYSATLLATHVVIFLRAGWTREQERLALEHRIAQAELDALRLQLPVGEIEAQLEEIEAAIERDAMEAETKIIRFSARLRASLNTASSVTTGAQRARAAADAPRVIPRREDGEESPADERVSRTGRGSLAFARDDTRARDDTPARDETWARNDARARDETGAASRASVRTSSAADAARVIPSHEDSEESPADEPVSRTGRGFLAFAPDDMTGVVPREDTAGAFARDAAGRRLPLPIVFLLTLALVPAVLLVIQSFHVVSAVAQDRPVAWDRVWKSVSLSWFSWPVTLAMVWLGSRVKRMTVLALAAAAIPSLWDFAFASREALLASSRTVDFLLFFGIALGALAYQRSLAWRRNAIEVAELESVLLRTRTRLLRLQLNPHFLFNALNSIAALLEDDQAGAKRMAAQLRHFVQRVLATSDQQEVPLGEELDLISTYVAIENVRFGDRLQFDVDADRAARAALVPSFLLQPLVENSVRHGLQPSTGGRVSVTAAVIRDHQRDALRLEVLDDGRPRGENPLREGIGLSNTRLRLRQMYGDGYSFTIDRDDGFRAVLTIPFRSTAGGFMKSAVVVAATLIVASNLFAQERPQERTTIPILDDVAIRAACTQTILEAREQLAKLEAMPVSEANVKNVLDAWDDANIAMENVIGPVAVHTNLHPEKKVRDAAQDCLVKVSSFENEVYQNEKLFQLVNAVKPETPAQTRWKTDLVESFEDSGVSLPKAKRGRAKEISDRLTVLAQEFSQNLANNNTRLTFTPAEYKGLPQSYIDRVKNAEGNIVVGFDYPDYVPFQSAAENEKARERYYIAYNQRGTARNLEILDEVTRLRKELATLYGYPSYAHYVTKRRMSETPQAVHAFLAEVSKSVAEVEKRDLEELRKLKAETLGTPLARTKMNRWDVGYWREKMRAKKYAVDQESTRQYFPSDATRNWLIDITSRMYGLKFDPAAVPVWHPDVLYYDVKDAATGVFIGGVYLDLYPRDGKFKHAAASPMRHGTTRTGRKPISVLMTNFDRKGMTYDEVQTFFHEFGHVMHNVLSETVYAGQGGTSVQRDFVEAPSQMYEEWARRPETLALLKAHCNGCPTIDAKTVQALQDARNYGKGIDYSRQHQYAAFDMALSGEKPATAMDAWKAVEGSSLLGHVPGTEFPGTFAHLTGGYAAGYYGYMWSEVIGKDMLSAWGGNILDTKVGMKFRKGILARGGEEPAKQLVEKFLGRPVSSKAFFDELKGK